MLIISYSKGIKVDKYYENIKAPPSEVLQTLLII